MRNFSIVACFVLIGCGSEPNTSFGSSSETDPDVIIHDTSSSTSNSGTGGNGTGGNDNIGGNENSGGNGSSVNSSGTGGDDISSSSSSGGNEENCVLQNRFHTDLGNACTGLGIPWLCKKKLTDIPEKERPGTFPVPYCTAASDITWWTDSPGNYGYCCLDTNPNEW